MMVEECLPLDILFHFSVYFLKILTVFFCLILTKGILQHQEAILHLATITRSAFRMVSFSSSLFQRVTSAKTSFATCVGQEAVCQICVCVTMRNTICPQKAAQNTSEVGNLSNRQLTTANPLKKHTL